MHPANDNPITLSSASLPQIAQELGARVRNLPPCERATTSALIRSAVALECVKALMPEVSNA